MSSLCVFRMYSSPLHFPVLIHLLLSRHLNDASHRETYESAHSAILAVFAAQLGSSTAAEDQGTGVARPTFVEKIVPFYIRCLLEVRPRYRTYFRRSLRKHDLYRTRLMASSTPHNCASRIAHLRTAQVGMHQPWANFVYPLSSRGFR